MLLLTLAFTVVSVTALDVKDGDKLFHITPKSPKQVDDLRAVLLQFEQEKNLNDLLVDVWRPPSEPKVVVDVHVPSELIASLSDALKKGQFEYDFNNLDTIVDDELKQVKKLVGTYSGKFNYESYNSYTDIVAELKNLAKKRNSGQLSVSTFDVGLTYEKRLLVGLKISSGSGNKPAIWIDGGIHAREWISPATVMYFIKMVLRSPEKYSSVLGKYDFYILPVFNADGYEYSRRSRSTRMWRKTRRPVGRCYGVDPNRNWDSKWNYQVGTSRNPCRDTYSGTKAATEKCVVAVAKYLHKLKREVGLQAYFNLHAYSQLVLTPWSYVKQYPSHYKEIARVANVFKKKVYEPYQTRYRVGPPPFLLYGVSGGSIDYTYEMKVIYSYCLELRDKGRYGFIIPSNQIRPSGIETTEAMMAMIDAMKCDFDSCEGGTKPLTEAPSTCSGNVQSHSDCEEWARDGYCDNTGYSEWMKENCCVSCRKKEITVAPRTQPPGDCSDKNPTCGPWARNGECTKNTVWMSENCAKSCNTCKKEKKTNPPTEKPSVKCLKEDLDDCPGWKNAGYCSKDNKYYSYMQDNCKQTCGFCLTVATTAAPTPPPPTPPPPTPPPTEPPAKCVDISKYCSSWKATTNYCKNESEYYSYMKDNCKRTCGFCSRL